VLYGCYLTPDHRTTPTEHAVGDGAIGFWVALRKVFASTGEQRCWVHKTAAVLNKLPTGLQRKAKADLHQIWLAETREQPSCPWTKPSLTFVHSGDGGKRRGFRGSPAADDFFRERPPLPSRLVR